MKWLELLKQIAPNVTRVAVVQHPMRSTWKHVLAGIEKAAPSFNVQVTPVDARDSAELERVLATFAGPDAGLIVAPNQFSASGSLRLRPAIKCPRLLQPVLRDGRGPDLLRARHDRSVPPRGRLHEVVANLRTAQMIGLTFPAQLVAAADHVIR